MNRLRTSKSLKALNRTELCRKFVWTGRLYYSQFKFWFGQILVGIVTLLLCCYGMSKTPPNSKQHTVLTIVFILCKFHWQQGGGKKHINLCLFRFCLSFPTVSCWINFINDIAWRVIKVSLFIRRRNRTRLGGPLDLCKKNQAWYNFVILIRHEMKDRNVYELYSKRHFERHTMQTWSFVRR